MKITYLGFVGFLAFVSNLACQPAKVIASVDKGFQPKARTFLAGDQILVEVKVPHVSGVDSWKASFAGDTPDGFTSTSTDLETVFTWIVPKDRISWFGTNGYTLKLSSAEYSRTVEVKAINQTSNVIHSVICIVLPFARVPA